MRVRASTRLVILAAAAFIIVGLSACQTKVGQAALVGKTSISETEVGSYVEADAPAPASGSIGAKAFVVQELVKKAVLAKLSLVIGTRVPTDQALATLHDSALSQVFQTTVSGAAADKELRDAAAQKGLKSSFDALYVHNVELSTAIGSYLQNATSGQQAALQSSLSKIKVKLNPRYGTWSMNNLAVDDTAMPSWLKSAS